MADESWWLWFLIALWPAIVAAILWHEIGHAVAARLVGLPLAAFGIGVRRPLLSVPLGQVKFYVARPFSSGLTIYHTGDTLEVPVRQRFWCIFGGPAATVLGLLVGIALWHLGWRGPLVAAWLATSTITALVSLVPFQARVGTMRIDNDARSLILLLRHGRAVPASQLGHLQTMCRTLAELLRGIQHPIGATYFELIEALIAAELGDGTAAREGLARLAEPDAALPRSAAILRALVEATIAVHEKSPDAEAALSRVEQLSAGDRSAQFIVATLRASDRLGRELDARPQVQKVYDLALAADRADWLCTAEVLRFEVESGDDPEAAYRELIKRHAAWLSDSARASLLALTTERLAQGGQTARARTLFADSVTALRTVAATIASTTTRQAYLARAAAPLRRASQAVAEGPPLFIAEVAEPRPTGRFRFASLAFLAGIAALASSATLLILSLLGPIRRGAVADVTSLTMVAVAGTAIAWLISLVRREAAPGLRRAAVAFVVVGLVLLIGANLRVDANRAASPPFAAEDTEP